MYWIKDAWGGVYFSVQKQPPEVFCKKGALKIFLKFSGKHLTLFFNKITGLINY